MTRSVRVRPSGRGPSGRWIGALGAIAAMACAGPVQVAFDERADFARMRTWGFAESAALSVDAPGESVPRLERQLVRLVADGFRALGYQRQAAEPDLRVRYRLSVERRRERVDVPLAAQLVPSLSHSPSYWVEGSETQERIALDLRLHLEVIDRSGRIVWKGGVRRRGEGPRVPDLKEAVGVLLRRFPRAAPAAPRPDPARVALRALPEAGRGAAPWACR